MAQSSQAKSARLRVIEGGADRAARGPTDEQLVDAVQQGDAAMAGLVYDRLLGAVDHALYRVFGRREHDHDDLVQAAFEQIVLTLSRRSYARACSLQTWASTIATHVAFNALRARRRERRVFDRDATNISEPEPPVSADLERTAGARADLQRVRWTTPEGPNRLMLDKAIGNLLRIWGNP